MGEYSNTSLKAVEEVTKEFEKIVTTNILENAKMDYDQKMNTIRLLAKEVENITEKAEKAIEAETEFCYGCNYRYHKKFFEEKKVPETRVFRDYHYDDYEERKVNGIAIYHICPRGYKNFISFT